MRPFLIARFPELLNSAKVDALLRLLLESDIAALHQVPEVLKIPKEILDYFAAIQSGEESRDPLRNLVRSAFPPQIASLVDILLRAKTAPQRP